ncbi:MAG: hypothetical protein NVS4B8_26940 [Herpetosiphon sp.]
MQKPRLKIVPGKILWMPVMLGFLVDNVLSLLVREAGTLIDPAVLGKATTSTLGSTTGIVVWVLGMLATGVGGYVAGRRAKEERVLHGVLVGGVGIILMLLIGLGGVQGSGYNGLDAGQQVMATLLGGAGGALSVWPRSGSLK